jgi:hypothetical protein
MNLLVDELCALTMIVYLIWLYFLTIAVFALIFFTYLPKSQMKKKKKKSNKFFHSFDLSEYSFTCPELQASGLARRLLLHVFLCWIITSTTYCIMDDYFNRLFIRFWLQLGHFVWKCSPGYETKLVRICIDLYP